MSISTVFQNVDSIAIGGFDGMHRAHQTLFSKLGDNGAIVVIETGYANLTPGKERESYTHYPILYLELDTIRHLDDIGFLQLLQKTFTSLAKIVVGYDFHFGKDRKYSSESLKNIFKGSIEVVAEQKYETISIHSHKIRQFLKEGDIEMANELLAHHYGINGTVVTGQGLGSAELVPTINLTCKGFLLPKEGVYVTLTRLDNEEAFHASVSFIGHRQTTDGSFAIETHIIENDVTCKIGAEIRFLACIRDNRAFDTLSALKEAIQNDIEFAKNRLKKLVL